MINEIFICRSEKKKIQQNRTGKKPENLWYVCKPENFIKVIPHRTIFTKYFANKHTRCDLALQYMMQYIYKLIH